jgi:hypothetical protein
VEIEASLKHVIRIPQGVDRLDELLHDVEPLGILALVRLVCLVLQRGHLGIGKGDDEILVGRRKNGHVIGWILHHDDIPVRSSPRILLRHPERDRFHHHLPRVEVDVLRGVREVRNEDHGRLSRRNQPVHPLLVVREDSPPGLIGLFGSETEDLLHSIAQDLRPAQRLAPSHLRLFFFGQIPIHAAVARGDNDDGDVVSRTVGTHPVHQRERTADVPAVVRMREEHQRLLTNRQSGLTVDIRHRSDWPVPFHPADSHAPLPPNSLGSKCARGFPAPSALPVYHFKHRKPGSD